VFFTFSLVVFIFLYLNFFSSFFIFRKLLLCSIVSVTDLRGNVIAWSSSGSCGFKGSRKSTPFAAQTSTTLAVKRALDMGMKQVEVNVSGPGSGRELAIRAIQALGVGIVLIRDVTLIPHNGCRPSKKRRI